MTQAPLPLLAVLEAVLGWQREPDAEHRERLGEALGGVVAQTGGRGAWLEADPETLPDLAVGWGTLADGPTGAEGAERVDLYAGDERVRTATLWLHPRLASMGPAVRAIELALDAAWSRADARQTAERLEALDAATRGIAGVLSLDRVLQLIVDRVRDLIGAQYAALGIVDDQGIIERFVTAGITREERARIGPLPRGRGMLGLIIRENRTYRVPDLARHPASSGFPSHHPPMTSFLGVPIRVKGRSVGNFYLTNKRTAAEFSEADERLVEMFALHAGLAIENARLHERLRQLAVVDERTRIGTDLHDGIIQALYGVGLSLEDVPDLMGEDPAEAATRVDRAIDSINLTIRDLRNFIFGLRPELVEQGDLLAGLGALVNEFRLNSVIDVELRTDDGAPDLAADRRAEVMQIVREALSNAARHSEATRASVTLAVDDGRLQLAVADNGRGFEPATARSGAHQGLGNMRARAARLGGSLHVSSSPEHGTTITVDLPVTATIAAVDVELEGGHG